MTDVSFDVPPQRVKVLDRVVDLEQATIRYGLSCGHVWTATLASFPILKVTATLGLPEVGEETECPECGPCLH